MKRLFFLPIILTCIVYAGELPVTIKGIDDGIRTNKQQDYEEALMNSKLQAIQQSGVEVSAITTIENFQIKHDLIESKSDGILLPGFQIIDIGYQTDGTYLIILSGRIKTAGAAGEDPSELYNKALLLIKQEKLEEALALLDLIVTKHEGSEYSVKAYESKTEIELLINNSLIYKLLTKKKTEEYKALNEKVSLELLDRKGKIHEVEVSLYYSWKTIGTSILSTTEVDCEFDYSFAVLLDGELLDKKTAKGRVNKDGHPKLEVFNEGTGLTITVEQRKYWNVIEIWGGVKP